MNNPVIAVALSGGVDSLVTGYLLKKKFKNIFGIHFKTGYEAENTDITSLEKELGFPVHIVDFSDLFEKSVVQYFINTYVNGKTPNPCLICNKQIKFGALLDHAIDLGADYISTGHYATIINSISFPEKSVTKPCLKKGRDPVKDQSYFLSLLSAEQLDKIIFPLADMTKQEVKKIAQEAGIAPLQKKESQDICFIHDNNFSDFILNKLSSRPEPGKIVNTQAQVVGKHEGLHRYTIGQRRGLNCPASEPYYVKRIDLNNNELVVCFKKDLFTTEMAIEDINWNDESTGIINDLIVKVRYSHKGAECDLELEGSTGKVKFIEPQKAVTPGQGAVFYKDDRVVGAGIIK